MSNTLYYGDNLKVLRDSIKDETVDLIYLDPPFNSNASYNVLFKAHSGKGSQAQLEAFEDTWDWGPHAEEAFEDVVKSGNPDAANLLTAMRKFLGDNAIMAYLAMMAVRLIELHRVLKPTGSLYLHCDPTASHYLKMTLDAVFGTANFRNEIIWQRTPAHSSAKKFAPIHDTILYYQKTPAIIWNEPRMAYEDAYLDKYYKFDDGDGRLHWRADLTGAGVRQGDSGKPWRGHNPTTIHRHWAISKEVITNAVGADKAAKMTAQEKLDALDALGAIYFPSNGGMPQYKRYRDQLKGKAVGDLWVDIDRINPVGGERLGYPTQKPLALMERIVSASSNPGDIVLDPFCGCGTTIHAAQKLDRQWIGIDITHLAIGLIESRLKAAFPGIKFTVEGTPKDFEAAVDLATRDKFQFQWWAVTLVNAIPYGGKKKGADSGIDGYYYCKPDGKQTEAGIVSVKGGEHPSVKDVRDLVGVVQREKAPVGVLITLRDPTGPMKAEAAKGGSIDTAWGKFQKIQLVTVKELLDGKNLKLPPQEAGGGLKQAVKEDTSSKKQQKLL